MHSTPVLLPHHRLADKLHMELRQCCKSNNAFQSHRAHRAALISISIALSQTPVYTARLGLFTSQLSLVLIAPTDGAVARLSWPRWLPACRL